MLVVAAIAVLIATIWLPVLRTFGSSMSPTLEEGQIVIVIRGTEFENGDPVSFYWGNKLLIKRCIAGPGQVVDMDESGNVYVDGERLNEPYVTEKTIGECDIELPYQVPDNMWFLMGDQRATSVDSRSTIIGCVNKDQVLGRVVYRIWPLENFGSLK